MTKIFLVTALLVVPVVGQQKRAPKPIASGFGAGAYRIGDGVSAPLPAATPKLLATSIPANTVGTIEVEAVVQADGTVRETRIVHPLKTQPGPADDAAMAAVKKQTFTAGLLDGKEVPVVVTTVFTVTPPQPPKPRMLPFSQSFHPSEGASAPVRTSAPMVPAATAPDGISGRIEIEAVVQADGTVAQARLLQPLAGTPGPADEAAMRAVAAQTFRPGMLAGKPVPVSVTTVFTVPPPSATPPPPAVVPASQFAWNPRGTGVPGYSPVKIRSISGEPSYTGAAMRAKIHGDVQLDVVVEPDGVASEIRPASSLDSGLDDSAVTVVKAWTFEAARQNDRPVPARITIAVLFVLH